MATDFQILISVKVCTLRCSGVSTNTPFGVGLLQDSGLCHSLTQSASLGTGESLFRTVEELGFPVAQAEPDPFFICIS